MGDAGTVERERDMGRWELMRERASGELKGEQEGGTGKSPRGLRAVAVVGRQSLDISPAFIQS